MKKARVKFTLAQAKLLTPLLRDMGLETKRAYPSAELSADECRDLFGRVCRLHYESTALFRSINCVLDKLHAVIVSSETRGQE
jgi:hypothetical protein